MCGIPCGIDCIVFNFTLRHGDSRFEHHKGIAFISHHELNPIIRDKDKELTSLSITCRAFFNWIFTTQDMDSINSDLDEISVEMEAKYRLVKVHESGAISHAFLYSKRRRLVLQFEILDDVRRGLSSVEGDGRHVRQGPENITLANGPVVLCSRTPEQLFGITCGILRSRVHLFNELTLRQHTRSTTEQR